MILNLIAHFFALEVLFLRITSWENIVSWLDVRFRTVRFPGLPDTDDTKDQTASRSEKIADEDFVQLNVMKKSSRGGVSKLFFFIGWRWFGCLKLVLLVSFFAWKVFRILFYWAQFFNAMKIHYDMAFCNEETLIKI